MRDYAPNVRVWADIAAYARQSPAITDKDVRRLGKYFARRYAYIDDWQRNRQAIHLIGNAHMPGGLFKDFWPRGRYGADGYSLSAPLVRLAQLQRGGATMTVVYGHRTYKVTAPDDLAQVDFDITPDDDDARQYAEAMMHLCNLADTPILSEKGPFISSRRGNETR